MTQKARVLELLRDGKPHTHHELYGLGCVAHSRISDLRRDGYVIDCWAETFRGERVSMYRLVSLTARTVEGPPDPVRAVSELVSSIPSSTEQTGAAAQLALLIPTGAYDRA